MGMQQLNPHQSACMFDVGLDARSGLGTEALKQDPDVSAPQGAMANVQDEPVVREQMVRSIPGTEHTQESPPAKSRRRSPPALSSLSLVEPTAQPSTTLTSPKHHDTDVSCRGSDITQQHHTLLEVEATQHTAQQPSEVQALTCLQRPGSDTSSMSQSHQKQDDAESGGGFSGGHQDADAALQDEAHAGPRNDEGCLLLAGSGDPLPSVAPEDSRDSSVSQKEELLKFLGNLSEKYELDVDVKAISPAVCFPTISLRSELPCALSPNAN